MANIKLSAQEISELRNRAIQDVNKREGDFGSRTDILRRLQKEQRKKLGFDDIKGHTTVEGKKRSKLARIASQRARHELNELIARREKKIENAIRPLRSQALKKKTQRIRAEERVTGRRNARSADQLRVKRTATSKENIELFTNRQSRRSIREEANLSREQRDELSRQEAQAKVDIESDPQASSAFNKVNEFLLDLTPEDIDGFEEQAADQFDDFFDEQRGFVNENLQRKLSNLNADFKFMSDREEKDMKEKVAKLDKTTADTLSESLDELNSRGMLNGGALRKISRNIIEESMVQLKSAEAVRDFVLRQATETLQQGTEEAEFLARKKLSDLGQQQKEAERIEVQRLADLESERRLKLQEAAGAGAPSAPQSETQSALSRAQQQVAFRDKGAARISQINPSAAPSFTATRSSRRGSGRRRPSVSAAELRARGRASTRRVSSRVSSRSRRAAAVDRRRASRRR